MWDPMHVWHMGLGRFLAAEGVDALSLLLSPGRLFQS